jgi:Tol biopolymer transport system component
MVRRAAAAILLLVGCKAELGGGVVVDGGPGGPDGEVNVAQDAGPDAMVPLGPWSAPVAIPGASSSASEDDCTLSSNKLELYFKRTDSGDNNLYVMTRASVTDAWSAPSPLTILNSSVAEESPRLSSDDLTLYFGRNGDILRTTRTAIGQPWTAPTAVTGLNTGAYEKWAAVCDSGYAIVSRNTANNGQDLFEGTVAGATTPLTALNTSSTEQGTFLTADCLRVYFQSNRDGRFNIYMASRVSETAAWSNPTALTDFNTAQYNEEDPWLSADERVFVYASNRNGNKDLFMATR